MIDALSGTLEALLTSRDNPAELAAAQISFDHPKGGFSLDRDTVNLFLYDIHENVQLRNNEPWVQREGTRSFQRAAPLRVDASYLATVWATQGKGKDATAREHRLLGQLLQLFTRSSVLPDALVERLLPGQPYPVQCLLAPAAPLATTADFWLALGLPMRPSLSLTVTLTLAPPEPIEGPVVTQTNLEFRQRGIGTRGVDDLDHIEESCSIGGQVLDSDKGEVAEADVTLVETGSRTVTDKHGYFVLSGLRPGRYTLQIRKGNKSRQKPVTVSPGLEQPGKGDFDLTLK